MGPLSIHPTNPRYFATPEGKAVYLTGSHCWNNLVDMTFRSEDRTFDFDRYLDLLEGWGHNCIRLWAWDNIATWDPNEVCLDFPWLRTGPGLAIDGKPRFDLTQLDPAYLERIRTRVAKARARGIYVNVMLFESWCTCATKSTAKLDWHVCALDNNVNQIDISEPMLEGWQVGWMGLRNPAVTAIQDQYLEWLVTGLNEFDNVLYEVSNEAGHLSYGWQTRVRAKVQEIERTLPKKHLVGICGGMGTDNPGLFKTLGDYIAPEGWTSEGEPSPYRDGLATWGEVDGELGRVPVILDTDHIWGIGGHPAWAWWSFVHGYHVFYMDRMDDTPWCVFDHPWWQVTTQPEIRIEMGAIRALTEEIDLNLWLPAPHLASSGHCLAGEGGLIAVGQPDADLDLSLPPGLYELRTRDIHSNSWDAAQDLRHEGGQLKLARFGECVAVCLRSKS